MQILLALLLLLTTHLYTFSRSMNFLSLPDASLHFKIVNIMLKRKTQVYFLDYDNTNG
uniref:Secreted protein n=1 Tax=Heterorhabditis bacteriophora TaxID=37862 RepID=A0A1I7W866_HETBA